MNEAREAKRWVLEALSRRPGGHGYEVLSVKGLSLAKVELLVKLLRLDGFVNAVFLPQSMRPGQNAVWPSTLTAKGRSYLTSLAERPVG